MPENALANLRDIHLPEAGGWWPPAPGWWILLALLLLSPLLWRAWRKRTRNPVYRRAALAELQTHYREYQSSGNGQLFVQATSALLKRVALQCYSTEQVASLSGSQWSAFLGRDQDTETRSVIEHTLEQLHSPQMTADIDAFFRFAQAWIRAREVF